MKTTLLALASLSAVLGIGGCMSSTAPALPKNAKLIYYGPPMQLHHVGNGQVFAVDDRSHVVCVVTTSQDDRSVTIPGLYDTDRYGYYFVPEGVSPAAAAAAIPTTRPQQ